MLVSVKISESPFVLPITWLRIKALLRAGGLLSISPIQLQYIATTVFPTIPPSLCIFNVTDSINH